MTPRPTPQQLIAESRRLQEKSQSVFSSFWKNVNDHSRNAVEIRRQVEIERAEQAARLSAGRGSERSHS